METKNAIIRSATIEIDDHGPLTSWLHLEYPGGGQGFGGYVLGDKFMAIWIKRIFDVTGKNNWANLPGTPVRVKAEWSKVHSIGHFLNEDWFTPAEEFNA